MAGHQSWSTQFDDPPQFYPGPSTNLSNARHSDVKIGIADPAYNRPYPSLYGTEYGTLARFTDTWVFHGAWKYLLG